MRAERGSNILTADTRTPPMVIILDGNSEIDARVRSNLCYLTCPRHSIRSRPFALRMFFSPKIPIFPHACATYSELPRNISTMDLASSLFYFFLSLTLSFFLPLTFCLFLFSPSQTFFLFLLFPFLLFH